MAVGVAKRYIGRTEIGHDKSDQQLVRPDRSSRKRRRSVKDEEEDEGTTDRKRKSPRLQEILNNQHQEQSRGVRSRPSRNSPRIQAARDLNQRTTSRGRGLTGSSTPTKKRQYLAKIQPQDERQALRILQEVNHDDNSKKDPVQPRTSKAQKSTKRRRCLHTGDESNHDAKRPRHNRAQRAESRTAPGKENFIEDWLDESCWSRRASTENETRVPEVLADMSRKPPPVLPSPVNSLESSTTMSRKSERSAASVHDTNYRDSLGHRNIYIECDDPPMEFMRRAHRITSRPRASPEIDDATADGLRRIARMLQNEAEDKIIKQMVPVIIPAMTSVPDQRLEMNSDQPWFNSVPVPLDPDVLTNPLPLPRPVPDLAFGYSKTAFNHKQLTTIDLLVDDQFGRSYAVPDQKIRFPFLSIEFKAQAKNGTHYVATNQVAGAGAIALNGHMELTQRSFGAESFDYDEPQFFSVTMDHELARINVHWLKAPSKGVQHSFHVEGLSKHLLDDANGVRAVARAIKNILDHGADARLRTLCTALDAYRETVVRNRETANAQRMQRHEVPAEPQTKRQARRRAPAPDPRVEGGASYEKEDRISRPSDKPVQPSQTERRPGSDAVVEEVEAPKRTRRHAPEEAAAEKNTEPGAVTKPNKRVASPESEQESPSSMTRTRQTRSSAKPPPVEVVATRAVWKQQPGWTFELGGATSVCA